MQNSIFRIEILISFVGKQRVPITSKSSKSKGATQHYVANLPKSAGARHYCSKIPKVPGTLGGKIFTFSFHFYYLLKKSEIYYKAWFLNRNPDFLSEKSIYLLISLFPLKKSEIYTQYSIIRNGDQRPPVEFLKISKILDSHHF